MLVFSSHDILNTRDDALSAPPSGRIVLPFAPKDLRSSFITFLLSDANVSYLILSITINKIKDSISITDEALKKGGVTVVSLWPRP